MKISLFKQVWSDNRGQSLLEIAVSLSLVAIIITILTITTLNGLKNSQFAKNQVLASSYAQQGVELVKAMRQRDCQIRLTDGTNYRWYDSSAGQLLVWPIRADVLDPANVSNTNLFIANSTTCQLTQNTVPEVFENGAFARTTELERVTNGIIRVTVIVRWDDFSGSHQSENVSLLTNY